MNRSRALRSALVSAVLVLLAGAAWLTFAPTGIGGATDYVTTRGNSMAPRFHTGDLAVIRPTEQYRVGDVVAYRSTLLNTVVLHRIIGRDGDRYVFKGDHNDFVDPTRPDRTQLVGKLWLRVPRAGVALASVRRPLVTGALLGGASLLLLLGAGAQRRRRRAPAAPIPVAPAPVRRPAPVPPVIGGIHLAPPKPLAKAPEAPAQPAALQTPVAGRAPVADARPSAKAPDNVTPLRPAPTPPPNTPRVDGHQILIGAAIAAAIAAVATLTAFLTPTTHTTTVRTPYTDQVRFGYHATPRPGAGPVYPGGALSTGDPVFLKLVDRISVGVGYRFRTGAPHRLAGTLDVGLRITAPTGWSRELPLAPAVPFDGDRADGEVTLDLARIRRLTRQVERLTGMPAGGSYSLAVIARVHAAGTVSGQRVTRDISPQAAFQLDALQLRPAEPAKAAAPKPDGVDVPRTVANTVGFRGHALSVAAARWIALAGLLLALLGALISRLARFRRPVDATSRVRARFGHLLVPIAAVAPHPGRTPIDVTTIDALVALAERGERLILHHHGDERDTYLVEDGVALYRFRVERDDPPAPRVLAAA